MITRITIPYSVFTEHNLIKLREEIAQHTQSPAWSPLQYYFQDGSHLDIIAIFSLCYIYKQVSGIVMGM